MTLMRLAHSTLTQKLKLTHTELPKKKTINDADEARKLDLDPEAGDRGCISRTIFGLDVEEKESRTKNER